MNRNVVFVGCSFTAGQGWKDLTPEESIQAECKDSPYLWVNICHNGIPRIQHLNLVNFGQGGASNTEIFENAARAISSMGNEIDIMFCQWTSGPRYNFNVGFELWNTSESLHGPLLRKHDIQLSNGDHWSREYVRDLLNRLLVMHHCHWEIVKIIDYSATLTRLATQVGFNIFFINGLCPWDKNYFTRLDNVDPERYTLFTKTEILNIESRDDQDIFKLYNLAHHHYQQAGGIDETKWVNLYNSFLRNTVDVNFDLKHPGKQSNLIFSNLIKEKILQFN
jgi:hypothetical protein